MKRMSKLRFASRMNGEAAFIDLGAVLGVSSDIDPNGKPKGTRLWFGDDRGTVFVEESVDVVLALITPVLPRDIT